MAFGKKTLEFSVKDRDGDVLTAILRKPDKVEETEFRKTVYQLDGKGRITRETRDNALDTRIEFFDLLVVDIRGQYLDKDGKKIDFSFEKPIPADVLKEAGCQSMKDVPNVGFKEKAIITQIEDQEEVDNVVKK